MSASMHSTVVRTFWSSSATLSASRPRFSQRAMRELLLNSLQQSSSAERSDSRGHNVRSHDGLWVLGSPLRSARQWQGVSCDAQQPSRVAAKNLLLVRLGDREG